MPLISVVMANYRAGRKIVRALESVLGQTVADLEVIVSDDASGDDSLDFVRAFMDRDHRVRLVEADGNGGPARARNRALELAQGQWIAVVDSDDIIHPERFERLLAAAAHFDSDIVADDLLHFHEDGSPARLLLTDGSPRAFRVPPEEWILAGIRPGTAPLGYLKPLIKVSALAGARYDETLRIGEDYDLVLRLLLAGANMQVVAEPWYLYRRHAGSISHRLSAGDVAAMIDNQRRLAGQGPFTPAVEAALAERLARLTRSHAYERLVAAIKQRDAIGAIASIVRDPRLVSNLWGSLADRQRRAAAPARRSTTLRGQLRLGAAASAERRVPAYVPPSETDWSLPAPRQTWAELADLCRDGARVICEDAAGLYAAGFIPAADLDVIAPASARHAGVAAQ
ncbi:glycosyltransferase family 2 protein [Devosia geojensis]|uniref:glycosyltransferase family 2 protein n=1 Tax=Devosia geojensis TaxID=443610 RepID=UPI000696DA7B|nr:glycosyltransferase family 2 protein [Devosia geojensis]